MYRHIIFSVLFSFCLATSGCGGSGPSGTVTGKVTVGGSPIAAQISFRGETASASAVSDPTTGEFTLSTGETNLVPVGKYQIAVSPHAANTEISEADYEKLMTGGGDTTPKASKIPTKYQSFGTSGLEYTVQEGLNTFDITLE
jgi:hypothetical protein